MDALISPCGKYRYTLHRKVPCVLRWVRTMTFIMLNPSTADAVKNDPTIKRCIEFAKRESCSDLYVVNLFAYRSTDPKALAEADDPIGPENMKMVDSILRKSDFIVGGWGAHKMALHEAGKYIHGYDVYCLGTNKDGSPKHPLYVKADQPLVRYR